MTKNKNKKNNHGFAAILIIIVLMSLVLIVTFSLSAVIITKNRISKNLVLSAQSYYSAESGIEDALLRVMNKDYSWTVANNFNLDESEINQSIIQDGSTITIESLSSYYNNERKVKTELDLTVDSISFHYGVQVGEGGLTMGNNSSIIGNLYSNGSVSGGGTVTGNLIVATGIDLDANGVWDTYNDDLIFGKSGEPIDIAMSFIPTSTAVLSQVSFYIKKYSKPNSGTIKIVEDSEGSPSTTVLATGVFSASKVGSSYGWVNFSFSSPADLTGSDTYWIIIDVDLSNNQYFSIGRSPGNVNSVSKHSSNWEDESWTTDAGDYEYKAWIGGLSTSVDGLTIEGDVYAHEIENCTITGDAYYQVESNNNIEGEKHPDQPDPPIVSLPISDSNIADWKADALVYGILDSSLCDISTNTIIDGGKIVCPDGFNLKGGMITLKGTLWIDGDLEMKTGSKLILDSSYGNNSGIIIVDSPDNESDSGTIIIENNVIVCGSQGLNDKGDGCADSNETYILMLSTHSGTESYAINVRNNAKGIILYAQDGTIFVKNQANFKEAIAYKLNLENLATVTYESGLSDASFTSGPGGGWIINDWNEVQ